MTGGKVNRPRCGSAHDFDELKGTHANARH